MSAQPMETYDAPAGAAEVSSEVSSGQYVTFSSNGKAYAVDVMLVREIRSWSPTTGLPDQPHTARGVLDIRGEVVQVFDLSALLGGSFAEATEGHVILVVTIEDRSFGILVDAVSDIIQVEQKDLRPSPNGNGLVSAIAKQDDKIVAILDLSEVVPHH